jgi:hypothetical protein
MLALRSRNVIFCPARYAIGLPLSSLLNELQLSLIFKAVRAFKCRLLLPASLRIRDRGSKGLHFTMRLPVHGNKHFGLFCIELALIESQ